MNQNRKRKFDSFVEEYHPFNNLFLQAYRGLIRLNNVIEQERSHIVKKQKLAYVNHYFILPYELGLESSLNRILNQTRFIDHNLRQFQQAWSQMSNEQIQNCHERWNDIIGSMGSHSIAMELRKQSGYESPRTTRLTDFVFFELDICRTLDYIYRPTYNLEAFQYKSPIEIKEIRQSVEVAKMEEIQILNSLGLNAEACQRANMWNNLLLAMNRAKNVKKQKERRDYLQAKRSFRQHSRRPL